MTLEKRNHLNLVEDYELTLIELKDMDYDIHSMLENALFGQEARGLNMIDTETAWLTELSRRVAAVLMFQPEEEVPEGYNIDLDKLLAMSSIVSKYILERKEHLGSIKNDMELEKSCLEVAALKLNEHKFH